MAAPTASISVIVPAHDEAAVIARGLASLTEGAKPGEIEVIVVCNGCRDETAEIARSFGDPVRVVETDRAAKHHALNCGDREARAFPRFYVDADVVLTLDSIRRVADVLRGGAVLAAAPRMRVDLSDRPWSVRAFYEVWLRLPYVNEDLLGCGVYALSEAGRRRFGDFPEIIADDEFVRLQFAPGERRGVDGAWFTIVPPRTLWRLIDINVRRIVGDVEIQERFPDRIPPPANGHAGALAALARQPGRWPALALYVAAKLASLAVYRWRRARGRHKRWARDETSRAPAS